MARRFIRIAQVKDKTGKCKAAIYRDIANGIFPAPYSIGARSVAWLESEVEAWIEKRMASRKPAERVSAVRDVAA